MTLSRRTFLQGGLGAVSVFGFSLLKTRESETLVAAESESVAEIPVVWLTTGSCSGCSVALLNSASPSIQEILLDQILPGVHLSLRFHATVMAAAGEQAMQAMEEVMQQHGGQYMLVVDGATASKDNGRFCELGEINGRRVTGVEQVQRLSQQAMAVLAVGACAAFGGIPSAPPNPTGCLSIRQLLDREGIQTPYVNIPGCPPHPDWIVGTIAALLIGGLESLELDELHRPAAFFSQCIHDNCSYRGHFEQGHFAESFGQNQCLLKLGCKGPITIADCALRKFNNGTSWCCEAGHPCIGCCHPDFPFEQSMFTPVQPAQMDYPAIYAPAAQPAQSNADTYIAVGLIGAGGFLAGVGVTTAVRKLKGEAAEDEASEHETEPSTATGKAKLEGGPSDETA